MADTHTKEIRSYNMSRIRSKDTKPEILVRRFLYRSGFRYRLHDKRLPGKPDIVLTKYRTVIFIHGCFWHGHEGCRYYVRPKSNTSYWLPKIDKNIERDVYIIEKIQKLGWHVITIWECELKNSNEELLSKLLYSLKNNKI